MYLKLPKYLLTRAVLQVPPTPPEPKPLDPPPRALCLPPPYRASFKVRVRNVKNTTQVAKFAPSLGPVPLPPTPPGTKALGPPSPSPCTLPHPTGHPSKHAIFLLFVCVRNVKNTTQVAKFAPSLGPVPLPSTPQSPWTPLRAPLYPPPPHRESFKKRDFSSFCTR